jgi:bifunctional DNA-binding transcriptional regulator/antitoxin component of YhaV-PrlF toxin-antitoxin module
MKDMPQLVKGGKYVFGWSKVGKAGKIASPKEAMEEYKFNDGEKVILINGSHRSGGFGITKASLLKDTPLSSILNRFPGLECFQIPKGKIIRDGKRAFCWTIIKKGGSIALPIETLKAYGLKIGDLLLVVRGSYLAIGFLVRGPIIEEALRHPELKIFE